jgi:lipopolysaccharide export system permease protein
MTSKLDRYFLREAIPSLLFGLIIYSSLAVISVTLPRLQWIVGTPLLGLGHWLLLQFPAALVQTLPIAMVLSVLLAFGRLASNNELQAVQAGGISLARSTRVFVMLGLMMAALALYMNEWVLPQTNTKVGSLYWQLTSGGKSGLWRLFGRDIPLSGYTLYFEKANRSTDELFKVRIQKWEEQQLTVIFAERAQFTDSGLQLFDYQFSRLDLTSLQQTNIAPEKMLESLLKVRQSSKDQPLTLKLDESKDELITNFSQGGFEDTRSIRETYQDSKDLDLSDVDRRKAAVLFHRKLAEPFANFSLLLVAVPLSLLYASSRSVAFGVSLLVTLVWYLLFTVGQLFAQAGSIPIWLGVWGANIVLALFGLYLLGFRNQLKG